jgi:putative redox protein
MATKQAIVKQVQGTTLVARADSGHWVAMDGSPTFGGSNAGSSPKELLLMALGGCTAMDVIPILRKKRSPVDNIEIHVKGEVREDHPQVFTDIHIEYVLHGNGINHDDVKYAIELSTTKYCAVSAMLSGSVHITHSYRIENGQVAPTHESLAAAND